MGFLHASTEDRLSASSNRHHSIDLYYEVLLWSHIGFLGRTNSQSRQQQTSGFVLDTSWLQGSLSASLHLNSTEPEDHGLRFQSLFCCTSGGMSCLLTIFLPLVKPIYHSPLLPPSLFHSYQKWSGRVWGKVKERIWKTGEREKWKMSMRGSWERRDRQTREIIFLTGTLTAQLILCKALLFKIMSILLQFSTPYLMLLPLCSLTALFWITELQGLRLLVMNSSSSSLNACSS